MKNPRDHAHAAQHELDALRAALDERLAALEAALAQPKRHPPLEHLVLELARVATAEAQAAAERACVEARLDEQARATAASAELERALHTAHAATDALRREAEEARAARDTQKAAIGRLRHEFEDLRSALEAERVAMQARDGEIEQARAALLTEHDVSASLRRRLEENERDIGARRQLTEQAQRELAVARRDAAAAQQTAEHARRETAAAQQAAEQARREAAATQKTADAAEREAADARRSAEAAQRAQDAARRELTAAQGAATALQRELSEAREAADAGQRDLAAVRRELAAAQRAVQEAHRKLTTALHDAEKQSEDEAAHRAAVEALEGRCTELDRACFAATARATALTRERDELAADLEAARRDVQNMWSAVEQRLEAIEAKRAQALHEAEARADAAAERVRELELQLSGRDRGAQDSEVELTAPLDAPAEPERRRVKRYRFSSDKTVEIQIDGQSCILCDLSVAGAQLLCPKKPEVNRSVDVLLPSDMITISCKGRIVWAWLEQYSKGKKLRYRAGIAFTAVDEAAVDTFIAQHLGT